MDWLQQVLDGTPDAETIEHLRRGFATWLRSASKGRRDSEGRLRRVRPLALTRCLGLHDSPERVRQSQRDGYLRAAAALLPVEQDRSWRLSCALHAEVLRFVGHQWLCWSDLTWPPPHAGDVDRLLFLAMRAGGGALPGTARAVHNILQS